MNRIIYRLAGMSFLFTLLITPWVLAEDTLTAITIDDEGRVGIGTQTPDYKLDVDGDVNAAGFKINGTSILESPWTPSGNNISYTDGGVGIGKTASSLYLLDVQGYVNARGFKIGGLDVAQSPWLHSRNNSIYYSNGNVGIRAIAPSASLQIGTLPSSDFGGAMLGVVQESFSPVGISLRATGDYIPVFQICNESSGSTCGYLWISKKGKYLCYKRGYLTNREYGEKDDCGPGTELNFQLTAELTEKIDSQTEEIKLLKERLQTLESKILQ